MGCNNSEIMAQKANKNKGERSLSAEEAKRKEQFDISIADLETTPLFNSLIKEGKSPSQLSLQTSFRSSRHFEQSDEMENSEDLNSTYQIKQQVLRLNKVTPIPVGNIQDYPYSCIGLVKAQIGNKSSFGTGFIVSQKIVLTCLHNVCQQGKSFQQSDRRIVFLTQYRRNRFIQTFHKEYQIKSYFFPKEFDIKNNREYKNRTYDYVFLEVNTEDNLQKMYGSFGLDFQEKKDLQVEFKTICGFPTQDYSTDINLTKIQGEIWLDDNIMKHRMETKIGMSGSPIFEIRKGKYYVIGVHSYKKKKNEQIFQAGGLRLSSQIFKNCQKWFRVRTGQLQIKDQFILDGCKWFKHAKLAHLTELDLNNLNIGISGCNELKRCTFPKLKKLNLNHCQIKIEGLKHLLEANWTDISELHLFKNNIRNEGCEQLSKVNWLKLKFIDLSQNEISNEGCESLKNAMWPTLKNLDLSLNKLSDQGCRHLAEANWQNLEDINIDHNQIRERGLQYILQARQQNIWRSLIRVTHSRTVREIRRNRRLDQSIIKQFADSRIDIV